MLMAMMVCDKGKYLKASEWMLLTECCFESIRSQGMLEKVPDGTALERPFPEPLWIRQLSIAVTNT